MSGVLSAFFVGGLGLLVVLAFLAFYVLKVIGLWKVLDKAGEDGWKSIIPVYNLWLQCRLTWSDRGFWALVVAGVVGMILRSAAGDGVSTFQHVAAIAGILLCLAALVLLVISYYWLCRAFDHGAGYTALFVFFSGIMYMVLGFSQDEYQGNVFLQREKKDGAGE